MSVQIYCDIADLKLIKKYRKLKIIKGFTTNPSLMRKAGAKNYESYAKEVIKASKNKPVSIEVLGDKNSLILSQAKKINSWGKNVFVKIPVTNSKGIFTGKVIKKLADEGVKMNITAVYTSNQTKRILKFINKNSKIIISVFAGRAGDAGKDPVPEIKKSVLHAKKFKHVKILWASVREPYNYVQASQLGCHLITVPPKIIESIKNFGKSYKQLTINTVQTFLIDSKKSRFNI